MTEKQKELLYKLSTLFAELAGECEDDSFSEIMTANNDLFPLSLDEMSVEWFSVARDNGRTRIKN